MEVNSRTCTKCGQVKLLDEFSRKPGGKYGRSSECKICHRKRSSRWYYENKDRAGIRERATTYGLSVETVKSLLASGCSICLEETPPLHIDHCHSTGRVRGALCKTCNVGLGMFRDDPKLLNLAAEYLQEENDYRDELDSSGNPKVSP